MSEWVFCGHLSKDSSHIGIPPFHNFSQNILHHLMHYSDEMRKELIQELINIWNGVEGC